MPVEVLQAQFDAALAPLLEFATGAIGLAVSGGGDSIALLRFAAHSPAIGTSRLFAITVDHGLRAESAREALFVSDVCEELGVVHDTLSWSEPNASQARARQARHRLLAGALRERGGSLLLTGHTLSDNIESFLIRARAASSWYGLTGMDALTVSPVWPEGEGIFVGRPMLGMHRDVVRTCLSEIGQTWCDDPSNENPKYERVRMRNLLEASPGMPARIARIQRKLAPLRHARDNAIGRWLSRAETGGTEACLPFPAEFSEEAFALGLSLTCMAVSGADQPARSQRSRGAAQKLMSPEPRITTTLGGAVIRKRGDMLEFQRETNRDVPENWPEIRLRLQHICAGLRRSLPA